MRKSKSLYECWFPGCCNTYPEKSSVDIHHIIPKGMPESSEKPFNKIVLCPSCHRRIFVPGTKRGIHSIKRNDSIILKGYLSTSVGKALLYEDSKGIPHVWYPKTKEDTIISNPF
jgi:5-methylcytosine-specific restriction endonuclease McrA